MNSTYTTLFVLLMFLGICFVRTRQKAARLQKRDWKALVTALKPVPIENITTIAVEYLQPSEGPKREPLPDLWSMIGEAQGIHTLYANAEVLIALASYAARWNAEEAYITVEQMRRDAAKLRRATLRLSMGVTFGFDTVKRPVYVQEAASAYYVMRERTLRLYSVSHIGRMAALRSCL